MIAALVLFPTNGDVSLEEATRRFNSTAPAYRGREGLRTKAYLYSEDGRHLGGFYIWESRAAAEATFTAEWQERVAALYGAPPEVRYFDVPVLIENLPAD